MNMATKQTIFEEKLKEYLRAGKTEKGRILDAVCSITGHTRKAAIRRFRSLQMKDRGLPDRRGRRVVYGKASVAALREVWECANQICAERLHPNMGEYVGVLRRDGMWKHNGAATQLLLRMSLGTMKNKLDRFPHIKAKKGKGATKPSNLKEIIPIRRGPWDNPDPGFGEVDTVAHCGSTLVGDYAYTVQYTDVSTIWTCLSAQ